MNRQTTPLHPLQLSAQNHEIDDRLDDLTAAENPHRHLGQRDVLGDELARLERLCAFAGQHPRRWRACLPGRQQTLSLWLFGIALGVAALDMGDAALALLDVLPGVPAGEGGRRALLQSLIAQSAGEDPQTWREVA